MHCSVNKKFPPLSECVEHLTQQYINALEGQSPNQLHAMFITEVERALFKKVLECTQGNQSKAAQWLGLARGTFRKRLTDYGLE